MLNHISEQFEHMMMMEVIELNLNNQLHSVIILEHMNIELLLLQQIIEKIIMQDFIII